MVRRLCSTCLLFPGQENLPNILVTNCHGNPAMDSIPSRVGGGGGGGGVGVGESSKTPAVSCY